MPHRSYITWVLTIPLLILAGTPSILAASILQDESEGILLSSAQYDTVQYDDYITISDITSLIHRMGGLSVPPNFSVLHYTIEPEGTLAPDTILPVAEIIYVTDGSLSITTTDTTLVAARGTAVYIPPGTIRAFTNAENETLQFYSIIDQTPIPAEETRAERNITPQEREPTTRIISEQDVSSLERGNISTNQTFTFSRLIHPSQGSYQIGFDLGTAHIPGGSGIPEHYIEQRSQLLTVLSGTGNISVGCQEYPLQRGDTMYIAPGAVTNLTAFEDMHLLVITYPYYEERYDISMPYACDYLYS